MTKKEKREKKDPPEREGGARGGEEGGGGKAKPQTSYWFGEGVTPPSPPKLVSSLGRREGGGRG